MTTTDILIIGGGIIGLSIAKELIERHPDLKIMILEKEPALAMHGSGRNSGVVHAGFYYTPDSLKAGLTRDGNRLLTEYCIENGLAINRCGKVVVARNEKELELLSELKRRGDSNGVELEVVDEKQLFDLEPVAKTFQKALYSPSTSIVDPVEVVNHIARALETKKAGIMLNEEFTGFAGTSAINTKKNKISYRHLINTAGLYADKIAHKAGSGLDYSIIPFKGLYMEYTDPSFINRLIYPVPDLNHPFLGVHFTRTIHGKIKLGPTAIPALWRENYSGLSNFNLGELFENLSTEVSLFLKNSFNFRELAMKEIKKYNKATMIKLASGLVKTIDPSKAGSYLTSGIRAQLLDKKKMSLVMDFVVEHGENSTHVLNAVSPAFTCAFSFSKFIVDGMEERGVV